jgi:uncharacterized protein (TIGR01777 family)
VKALQERGDEVVATSRSPVRAASTLGPNVETHGWNPGLAPCPHEALAGTHAIVNLLGESVAGGRWNQARKDRILDSRVGGTRHLFESLRMLPEGDRAKVLVSASASGYYGDRGDEELAESATPGDDFLASVCVAWEKAALRCEELGLRVVTPRFGIILGKGGGPLEKMRLPFKLGLGGKFGSGRQYMPWVQLADVVSLILFAIDNESVRGPLNCCPQNVTNAAFTKALGSALHRPTFAAVPGFVLKKLAGEMAAIFLGSQRTIPTATRGYGYEFKHPDLAAALEASL